MWLSGDSSAEVIRKCGKEGVDFLQDGLAYRLPWAMEAVRVHCLAIDRIEEDWLSGLCAVAVETGSLNKMIMTMIRNGLSSREAAKLAVASTNATFGDYDEMMSWLQSEEVVQKSKKADWPSVETKYSWLKFFHREKLIKERKWSKSDLRVDLAWCDESLEAGNEVILEKSPEANFGFLVLKPDFTLVGETK